MFIQKFKITMNGIDIKRYLDNLAIEALNNGFDYNKLHYIVAQKYTALLINSGAIKGRNDYYKIVKGSFCRYRKSSPEQYKEINEERAILIGDLLFFIKDTDPYSYSHIMCILANSNVSSYKGATFPIFSKYNKTDNSHKKYILKAENSEELKIYRELYNIIQKKGKISNE